MVSIDNLQEVVNGLFKKPIIGSLKSKMAEICHLKNRHDVTFFLPRVARVWIKCWRLVQNDMSTVVTWYMACHPRATCHTAGCCYLANSMS